MMPGAATSLYKLTNRGVPGPDDAGVCWRDTRLVMLSHGSDVVPCRRVVSRVKGDTTHTPLENTKSVCYGQELLT